MNRLAVPLTVALVASGIVLAAQGVPAQAPAPPQGESAVGPAVAAVARLGAVAAAPVCPGPQTLLAPEGGRTAPPPGPVVVAAAAANPTDGGGPPSARLGDLGPAAPGTTIPGTILTGSAGVAVTSSRRTSAGPVRLEAQRGGRPPTLSAVQAVLATGSDLRGLAASGCPAATTDAWLVGGGTAPGRRGRLLLANPTAAVATVDVTLHGPGGPRSTPAATGVAIAPGGTRTLLLDALAPGLDALAVHVRARTGRFVATLHDSVLRGLVPGGADDVTPAAGPARRQLVPGISVPRTGGQGRLPALPRTASAPGAVAVRVATASPGGAVVRVELLGPDGPVELAGEGVLTVPGGGVADLPLDGVPPGSYAAVVEADVPVVAGALVGRGVAGGQVAGTAAAVGRAVPPSEFAWAASVLPMSATAPTVVAAPVPALVTAVRSDALDAGRRASGPRPAATLVLSAPDGAVSVELTQVTAAGASGEPATVRIPSRSTVRVRLAPATAAAALRPSGGAPVIGALEVTYPAADGPLISVVAVRAGPAARPTSPRLVQDRRLGTS